MKIKTRGDATKLLDNLILQIEQCKKPTLDDIIVLENAQKNLVMMKNSIERSPKFFEDIFKDKTIDDVKEWIDKESRRWK